MNGGFMKEHKYKPILRGKVRQKSSWINLEKFHEEMKRWHKGIPEQNPLK